MQLLSLSPFFVKKKNAEDEKVKELMRSYAFLAKSKEEQKAKPPQWHAFNLIPTQEQGFDEALEIEYQNKALCYYVAENDYDKLYNSKSLLELYEMIMLKKAFNYRE